MLPGDKAELASPYGKLETAVGDVPNGTDLRIRERLLSGAYLCPLEEQGPGGDVVFRVPAHWLTYKED